MAKTQWTQVQFPNLNDGVDRSVSDAIQLLFKGLKDHSDAFTSLKSQLITLQTTTTSTASGSGVTGVTAGGTGAQSLQSNAVLIGQGANPVQAASPGTAGGVLTSNGTGTNPSFQLPIGYQPLMDGYGNFVMVVLPGGFIDTVTVAGYGL